MSTHSTMLEKKCLTCDSHKVQYHMKNPFIDDFADECPKCEPGEALNTLNSWARSAAREEQARDYASDQESKSCKYDNSEEE